MPGPPTPLSGCPLKRLELHHDNSTSRVYDAAQMVAALTLTLEAQRSIYDDNNDLVLQVHCGLQRVLSFKLTDLLQSPSDKTDSVSIERRLHQLCIKAQRHHQRILATFAEARDFNVAACMLKKFGLQVKDGIPTSFSIQAPARPTSPLYTVSPATNPGPRLSPVTPLSWPASQEQSQNSPDLSFTSMLNSEVVPTNSVYDHFTMGASSAQAQHMPASLSQNYALQLNQQAAQMGMYNSYPNPYNVFLGKQLNHPHQPRVGSPLRNSFEVGDSRIPTTVSVDRASHYGPPTARAIQNGRSISAPINSFNSPESSILSRNHQPEAMINGDSQDNSQTSSYEGSFSCQDGTQNSPQPHTKQDIHELMPRPRDLPFAQRKKTADTKRVSKPKPKMKTNPKPKSEPTPKPTLKPTPKPKPKPKGSSSPKAKQKSVSPPSTKVPVNKRQARKSDPVVYQEAKRNVKKPASPSRNANTPKAKRQTALSPSSIVPVPTLPHSPLQNTSPEPIIVSTMLVAGAGLLREVNEATFKLLEQYEIDVARGCNEATCARFYAEQIHSARRDFWVAQLIDM
ncbi:hypothetical protein PT974_12001 [Cladobotryum mycophilum]|uniref:Uncharacterized protein n=1 Tax=Cladobotryum mycophilum TaxID=491253 RepID=A0ABR0S6T9_9HYPO